MLLAYMPNSANATVLFGFEAGPRDMHRAELSHSAASSDEPEAYMT